MTAPAPRHDDLHDLDAAFTLPDAGISDAHRALYEVLVHRMRSEAKHLPMNTVQLLLIERIAFNYVHLRARENGDFGGFTTATMQKDFNSFWLSMTAEFNRLLGKSEPLAGADRRHLMREMQQIIVSTVSTVSDTKIRQELLDKMAGAFQAAGM